MNYDKLHEEMEKVELEEGVNAKFELSRMVSKDGVPVEVRYSVKDAKDLKENHGVCLATEAKRMVESIIVKE